MSMQSPFDLESQPVIPETLPRKRLNRSVSVGTRLVASPPKPEPSLQGPAFFSPTNASTNIKARLPLMPHRDAAGELLDFNDKTQIYNLIASVNEKADKIKIIDLVRKRREEIDNTKKKRKKQKAATNLLDPVYSPFDSEFQPTHTINRFKQSLKEIYNEKSLTIVPTVSVSTADNTPLVRQSQKPKTVIIVNKNKIAVTDSDDSDCSDKEGTHLVFPNIDNSAPEKTPSTESPKAISRSSLSSGNGLRFGNQNTIGDNSAFNRTTGIETTQSSISQRRRLTRKLEVKFGSVSEFRKPAESLSIDSSPAKSTQSGFSFSKRTDNFDIEPKTTTNAGNDRENDMYVLGKKKLKKDIFKYLMKTKEGERNLVLGLAQQKEEKLRNIETSALIQYVKAQPSEDLTYFPNHLLKIKQHKIEKARTQSILYGPDKRSSVHIKQRPDPKGALMRIDQGARSSSFIRKVDPTRVFCEPPQTQGSPRGRKIDLNDSLVSHTETRLDCLYKEARQMNKALKKIEDKIDMSKSKHESKSLLKLKDLKIKDYYEHTTKIKILIKKKVTDVYS